MLSRYTSCFYNRWYLIKGFAAFCLTGWATLKKLKIPVKCYYAIESDAMEEDGIVCLDSIFSLTWERIKSMAPIHLLVVGPGWPEKRIKQDLSEVATLGI